MQRQIDMQEFAYQSFRTENIKYANIGGQLIQIQTNLDFYLLGRSKKNSFIF